MRHDLLPLAVAPSPPGMREAARTSALVAPPRLKQRSVSRFAAACAGAIALAAVAAAAHQHFGRAPRTCKHPPGAPQATPCPNSRHRHPRRIDEGAAPSRHRSSEAKSMDQTRPPVQYCVRTRGQHGGARCRRSLARCHDWRRAHSSQRCCCTASPPDARPPLPGPHPPGSTFTQFPPGRQHNPCASLQGDHASGALGASGAPLG